MQKSMTSGNSLKLLLTFMVPLIIGNIFQQMYSISDIIIVGRTIGVNALASVGAAAPIFMLLVMMTMGMSNGLTVITGQFFGANDFNNMRRSVAMSMMLSVISVIILAVADIPFGMSWWISLLWYGAFALMTFLCTALSERGSEGNKLLKVFVEHPGRRYY